MRIAVRQRAPRGYVRTRYSKRVSSAPSSPGNADRRRGPFNSANDAIAPRARLHCHLREMGKKGLDSAKAHQPGRHEEAGSSISINAVPPRWAAR